MNLSLRHLRALHAISRHGTFVRAAEALGVVPSALTETIRQLEDAAGAPLFDRRVRPPALTPLALDFLAETRDLLAGIERAGVNLRAAATLKSGRLAVGAAPSAIYGPFVEALARFGRDHPSIRCSLHDDIADRLAEQLQQGVLDLAVAGRARPTPDLTQTELGSDPFGLACAATHPLAKDTTVRLSDIDPGQLVALSPGTGTRQLLTDCPDLPAPLKQGRIEVHSTIAQLCLIRAGAGVALMPRNAALVFGDPAIRFLPINDFDLRRRIYLLEPAHRPRSHVAARFIESYLQPMA